MMIIKDKEAREFDEAEQCVDESANIRKKHSTLDLNSVVVPLFKTDLTLRPTSIFDDDDES